MAKKQLKADQEKEIKSPEYQKQFERQYAEIVTFMIEQIIGRFENNALKGLQKSTTEKFEDAQIGNFASVFLKLAKSVKRKILKQFNNKRLEQATRKVLSKANNTNQDKLYSRISKEIGIDKKKLIAEEGLKPTTNALILETAQWAKKLRDDTLEEITAQTLRSMTQGTDLQDIIDELKQTGKERKNKAKFIARNQIANFNSISTKIRAQNLGIQEAIWITSRDERVRKCHQVRDGKRFDLAEGLYSSCDGKKLLPGTDYNCRCDYRLIIPEFENA